MCAANKTQIHCLNEPPEGLGHVIVL